ncbi:diphthamide biosynthesis enzyme Dph1/Dph2 domain protein [Theileria parva strain Muguga]|uniref:diphthamide biosynthesis enzyme Dph1/Dph2 domain protein n=1 Tax=Theileria parva strain Muguga TaxID=333668 RepID=UPI001C61A915|nr:diphthamide biosynthesis enzyme Dph1/Dph2 domain protein [Theileria parva strain Muguga]KAF5153426.1 diphthamide biosynthesis enzyme Dph1/Dph2 domain protein [Theileria parva strain Muguga]
MDWENLEELLELIVVKNFKVVLIQCSDTNESIRLCDVLQEKFNSQKDKQFFILGDVLTGNCCPDLIASNRFQTDCIVYIGESCHFELETQFYIFFLRYKLSIDFSNLKSKVEELVQKVRFESVIFLYHNSLHHLLQPISQLFLNHNIKFLTHNNVPRDTTAIRLLNRNLFQLTSSTDPVTTVTELPDPNSTLLLYTTVETDDRVLQSLALEYPHNTYQITINTGLSHDNPEIKLSNVNEQCERIRLKRYAMVEKVKQTKLFGIITLTKCLKGSNTLRTLLHRVIELRGGKSVQFSMNNLTENKLYNFPQVELFILLSCNYSFPIGTELRKLIVLPYEVLVGLNIVPWGTPYIFSFTRINTILSEYLQEHNNDTVDTGESEDREELRTGVGMSLMERYENLYDHILSNDRRSFRGVEPQFSATPVVLKGSHGVPTSYLHEFHNFI